MIRARSITAAATVAALCALPALAAPADAAKKKVTCTKRGGDTILRDTSLRVYQTTKAVKGDPDASTITVRFCTPGTKSASKQLAVFANTLDESLTVRRAVRGTDHLGLELDVSTGTVDATSFWVYRLSTRKQTFAYSSEDPFEYALTAGGGVALLEGGALRAFDGAGERAVATGASAIATSGDTVYWTAGGAAASAALSGEATRSEQ